MISFLLIPFSGKILHHFLNLHIVDFLCSYIIYQFITYSIFCFNYLWFDSLSFYLGKDFMYVQHVHWNMFAITTLHMTPVIVHIYIQKYTETVWYYFTDILSRYFCYFEPLICALHLPTISLSYCHKSVLFHIELVHYQFVGRLELKPSIHIMQEICY